MNFSGENIFIILLVGLIVLVCPARSCTERALALSATLLSASSASLSGVG